MCTLIGLHYIRKSNVEKNSTNALLTTDTVIFLKGFASGNLVVTHMIISKNWLPILVFGSGPVMWQSHHMFERFANRRYRIQRSRWNTLIRLSNDLTGMTSTTVMSNIFF